MTESAFGQWFFLLMIGLPLGWAVIAAAWERRMRRRYRENQEIMRRMLGERKKR